MNIAQILELQDNASIREDVVARIKSVSDLRQGPKSQILPMTLEDSTGTIRASWFNPTETDWKILKGSTATLTPINGKGIQRSSYQGTAQVNIFGDSLQLRGKSSPGIAPSDPSGSGAPSGDTITEAEIYDFHRRAMVHLEILWGDRGPNDCQGLFAALNTLTIAALDGRLDIRSAQETPQETEGDQESWAGVPDTGGPDDDIPF